MALWYTKENENYRLGVWKTEEAEEALARLTGLTPPTRLQKEGRRKEFLAVRALCIHMGIRPDIIDYLPSGKPFLMNSHQNISISHTKDYVAVLLSDNPLTGVDIEFQNDRIKRVRKRFMHTEEEKQLTTLITDHPGIISETTGLLLHWCTKEALFKAIPDKDVNFAKELQLTTFEIRDAKGQMRAKALRSDTNFLVDYFIEADFVLTCCFSARSR
jgi:4'-phosphopantetheinyl transferase